MIGGAIARYRIAGKLGRGGIGEVYRAQDIRGKQNRDHDLVRAIKETQPVPTGGN